MPIDVAGPDGLLADWIRRPKVVCGPTVGPCLIRVGCGLRSTVGRRRPGIRIGCRRGGGSSSRRRIWSRARCDRGRVLRRWFQPSAAWMSRPQAAALLAMVADPDRGFDAVVVGEYERAFYGDQLLRLAAVFDQHGVQLWLPEAHGSIDSGDPAHQALVMLLGAQSRREVLRCRFRTSAAMRAQAREQGRYLGGRPPYGYRLVDAGPHPNAVHAGWGRRLRRLEPDPATAPTVRWIFEERLTGRSVAGIARALNEQGVPPPSIMDPGPGQGPRPRTAGRHPIRWYPDTWAGLCRSCG